MIKLLEEDDYDDAAVVQTPFNVWCACHLIQLCAKDAVAEHKEFRQLRKVIIIRYLLKAIL